MSCLRLVSNTDFVLGMTLGGANTCLWCGWCGWWGWRMRQPSLLCFHGVGQGTAWHDAFRHRGDASVPARALMMRVCVPYTAAACPADQWPGAETYTRSSGGTWTKIWSHDITLMPDDGATWTLSLEAKNMGVIDREFGYAGCGGWLLITIPATTTAWTVFAVSAQRCIGQG